MRGIYRHGIEHPLRTLLIAAMVTLALSPGLLRLQLRTDGHALVPDGDRVVRHDDDVRRAFGIRDVIVVLIRSNRPEGIYHADVLAMVARLSEAVAALEGTDAEHVVSLATEKGDRHKPRLDFRRFLEPLPRSPAQIQELRDDLAALEVQIGSLVSGDGTGAAIHVGVPPGTDRAALYAEIARLAAAARTETESVDVIGAPVAEALLGTHILEDLGVPGAVLGDPARHLDGVANGDSRWSTHRLRRFIGRTIGLVPLAFLVMAVVFFVAFRSLAAVAIPLLEVGASLTTVFALMGWFGVPVYLTTAVLPVILTSIGVADEIHILSRYRQRARQGGDWSRDDPTGPIRATMDDVGAPIVRTSITTAIAFAAFMISPVGAVQAFGAFAAIGIAICMVWSLAVTPALLVLVRPERFAVVAGAGAVDPGPMSRAAALLAASAMRYRRLVFLACGGLVLAAPLGISLIRVQDSWIDGFAEETSFARATRWFDEHFYGAHILLVDVQTEARCLQGSIPASALVERSVVIPADGIDDPAQLIDALVRIDRTGEKPPGGLRGLDRFQSWVESVGPADDGLALTFALKAGTPRFGLQPDESETFEYEILVQPLTSPRVLRAIDGFERFIAGQEAVGGVLGPARYLATTEFILRKRAEGSRVIPDLPRRIQTLWQQYERIRGPVRTRELVDPEFSRALVTVFLEDANFEDTARLTDAIRVYQRQHLAPLGITISFAGDVAVSQALIDAIVTSQLRSLLLSLGAVFCVAAIVLRSIRRGLYVVLPCAGAVLVAFTIMGLVGMPFGVATSMFAGMTLGIGVDYAIHLIARVDAARTSGLGETASVLHAAHIAGPAILIDALAVGLGFGVLCLSQVPANGRLGLLAIICIASCFFLTLIVLPALMGGRVMRD